MELSDVDVYRLDIPLNDTYEIAGAATAALDTILVVLADADGHRGLGTADPIAGHPIPQTAAEIVDGLVDDLLPTIADRTPQSPNELLDRFDAVVGQENGKCALEMAFLDLFCRRADVSLADFFGGALVDREPLNAWVGVDDPRAMATDARRWRDRGFESMKMKIDGTPDLDIERVKAVRAAIGDDMQLRVDANEGYANVETAIEVAGRLEAFDLAHIEQPVPRADLAGLAEITAATPIPILADEPILSPADGYRVVKADAADRLKFKILKSGGTIPVRRGLDLGSAAGVDCVVGHGFCTAPAASAELQLAATHRGIARPVETVGPLKIRDAPFTGGVVITDGTATVPDGPGLGVGLDDDRLEEFVVETVPAA